MISVFERNAVDFDGNGIRILEPTECIVEERAGELYQVTLEHPLDGDKSAYLEAGNIIRCNVPVRESPAIQVDTSVTRRIMTLRDGYKSVTLYRNSDGTKKIKTYKKSNEFVELSVSGDYTQVAARKGGKTGWALTAALVPTGETVTDTPAGSGLDPVPLSIYPVQAQEQLFRIRSVEVDTEAMTVRVTADHIFYDLMHNIVDNEFKPNGEAMNTALNTAWGYRLDASSPFTIHCDISNINITGDYTRRNYADMLLSTADGIVAQSGTRIVRDNFDVWILPDYTRDTGYKIRYARELQGVEMQTDMTDVVTRIIPVGKNRKGKPIMPVNPDYVDSPNIAEYPFAYCRAIEYNVQTGKNGISSDSGARSALISLAQEEYSVNHIDLPTITATVDFAQIADAHGYEEYRDLLNAHLYDTIHVQHPAFSQELESRVIGYTWDCILQRYQTITLGDIDFRHDSITGYNLIAQTVQIASHAITTDDEDDLGKRLEIKSEDGNFAMSGDLGIVNKMGSSGSTADINPTDGIRVEQDDGTYFQANNQKFGLYKTADNSPIAEGGIDEDGKGYFASNRMHDPTNMLSGHIDTEAEISEDSYGYNMKFMSPDFDGQATRTPDGWTQIMELGVVNQPKIDQETGLYYNDVQSWLRARNMHMGNVSSQGMSYSPLYRITPFYGYEAKLPSVVTETITLLSGGWSSGECVYTYAWGRSFDVDTNNQIIVDVIATPSPGSMAAAQTAGVYLYSMSNESMQGASGVRGKLTFKCASTPSVDISINLMYFAGHTRE